MDLILERPARLVCGSPSSPPTKALIYGNLLHQTLQTLFSSPSPSPLSPTSPSADDAFSPASIRAAADLALADDGLRNELWKIGLPIEDVRAEVRERAVQGFGRLKDVFLGGQEPKVCPAFHRCSLARSPGFPKNFELTTVPYPLSLLILPDS